MAGEGESRKLSPAFSSLPLSLISVCTPAGWWSCPAESFSSPVINVASQCFTFTQRDTSRRRHRGRRGNFCSINFNSV